MVQLKLNGAEVSVLRRVAPWKNSTLLIVPSESLAVASTVKLAGAVNTALFAGFEMLTAGRAFEINVIAVDVVTALLLSVALAVSE